jgi:hypothetical protein
MGVHILVVIALIVLAFILLKGCCRLICDVIYVCAQVSVLVFFVAFICSLLEGKGK